MIQEKIRKIVSETCRNDNHFGFVIWMHHIKSVLKYSRMMADYFKADKEIVEISALLHDFATIKDYSLWNEHHKYGAQMAGELLTELGYPNDKIEQVKHCILSHRSSRNISRETVEAQCLADGDAMAHFDALAVMFYIALILNNMSVEEANKWVLEKLTRSWNKLSSKGKTFVHHKYEAVKLLLVTFEPQMI